ncbi:MAG: AarF/ABC1/UbiB kinase family protein [Saprospiraceae bacterium]|nr:AarF/ABC1/UbiB kinase family protein [Saprospiraceae bacterium]
MAVTQHIQSTAKLLRYEKVVAILIKYGFEDLLSHPPFNKIIPQTNVFVPVRHGKKVSQFSRYERIRMACEELGTTFIKFAQIASNRPDLLPEELITELEKLQDQAPEVPIEDIKETLEQELPAPFSDVLDYFNPVPLARASMAQVHRARLRGGKEVVLKIQRPGIQQTIELDIAILKNLVSIVNNYFPQYLVYQPQELVKMFEESITEELSFNLEANNLEHFQKMFQGNEEVFIPSIYRELCTDKIICMELVEGYKITDLKSLQKYNITGKSLAKRGIRLYFEQVFEHGFFHADPHPGNIFVLKDGRIAFIDYGMVGTVIDSDKILFARILLSMYERDVQGLKKAILKFSSGLTKEEERAFEYDVIYFLRQYSRISIENIDGNEVMRGLNSLFYDYKIKIPSNLLLLIKALVIIEGVGLKLDPEYDIIENIGPFVQRLISKKYNPNRLQKELFRSIEDTSEMVKEFPSDVRSIINKIKEGKIHVEIEHKGLGPFAHSLDKTVNRLSFTLIIVAVIIASSLIIVAKIPPFYYEIPLLGVIGFTISGILTLWLINAIRKANKKENEYE